MAPSVARLSDQADDVGDVGTDDARTDPERSRCKWCRRPFVAPAGPGRPRLYCRRSCRQRDFEARQRLQERGLTERELIVTRSTLDTLRDDAYVLACAVEDAERDLADAQLAVELRDIVTELLAAARPIVASAALLDQPG